MNIEHRTSNVQHRIMHSVYFKKTEQNDSTLLHSTFDILRFSFNVVSNEGKLQITSTKLQMVRQAVRQAHGPEQSRRTHHPEPTCREPHGRTSRRVNLKFQYPITETHLHFPGRKGNFDLGSMMK